VSPEAAERIAGSKKPEMAEAAEGLVAGTGWLPLLLRRLGAPEAAGEPQAIPIEAEAVAA
jgi:ParB family chromosome partitioning protein